MKKTLFTLGILTILLYACKDEEIMNTSDNGFPISLKDSRISKIYKDICQNIARIIAINNSK